MSERTLQNLVVKYLRNEGRFVIKTQAGRGTPIGTPDVITLDRMGHFVGLEFKDTDPNNKYHVTPEQRHQANKIIGNGGRWFMIDNFSKFLEIEGI